MDDEYDELDFGDQDGPSLFDAPPESAVVVAATVTESPAAEVSVPVQPEAADLVEARPVVVSRAVDIPEPPLALYRRYRPDTFGDVIGQEHVTEPLKRALLNNRVNHAYLFSGPRGCGKTTSARILARALNCENGPTPEPCGRCQSCRDLARGGAGSIDVIEIDAASHGGVDDARDLRERAFFAPVHSRYKIYIVDEAHMVTTAGFNALLKLVEEPPPHVKFIFATTEPEKVIGTIRSRTHHYPFRLVPPRVLGDYLRRLCDAEGVAIEASVLPLVVRAGAGSVRDSLSVLDQLLGGAGEQGVTYDQSVALLGFTPDALLDEIVDAFAAGDGAGVFATIDKVIEVGQDPRRFAEDLLRRLRDLVIVASVPDAASSGLIDVASDQAERLAVQAAGLGAGELTRAAEVMAEGLVAMRGTTAPRLHLELMCARVLLPGSDADGRGIHARLDRLERRLGMPDGVAGAVAASVPSARLVSAPTGGGVAGAPATPRPPEPRAASIAAPDPKVAAPVSAAPSGPVSAAPSGPVSAAPSGPVGGGRPQGWSEPPPEDDWAPPADRDQAVPLSGSAPVSVRGGARAESVQPAPVAVASVAPEPVRIAPAAPSTTTPASAQGPGVTDVRRLWPEVLEEVKRRRRFTWMTVSQHAQVAGVVDGALVLSFANSGARDSFLKGGSDDVLRDALVEIMGADLRISAVLEGDQGPGRTVAPQTVSAPTAAAEPTAMSDVGDRNDPDVADTDAESLLRDMLHAEVIDD